MIIRVSHSCTTSSSCLFLPKFCPLYPLNVILAPDWKKGPKVIFIIFVFPIIIPISLVESKSLKVGKSLEIKLKYLYPNWEIKTNKISDSARGLSLVSAELAVQNSVSRPGDLATLQSYKLTTLQPYILTILQHYNLTTLQSFNQKLMKTPSNPQFSPIGPGNCREKTLIATKFLNPKVCFGVPD